MSTPIGEGRVEQVPLEKAAQHLVSCIVVGREAVGLALGLALLAVFGLFWLFIPRRETRIGR